MVSLDHPALGTLHLERDLTGRVVGLIAQGVRARWSYAGGHLVGYDLETASRRSSTALERDDAGRVRVATLHGAATRYDYDEAGQLISADGPDAARRFSYDANGRLIDEQGPHGDATYDYDAAGQLVGLRRGGKTTRFDYDASGRRVGQHGPEGTRTFSWDEFGHLAGIDATPVEVDALGELAQVGTTALAWDSAQAFSPPCAIGDDPVVSCQAPWAIVQDGTPEWLAPDWTGSVGPERDPWGAPLHAAAPGPVLPSGSGAR